MHQGILHAFNEPGASEVLLTISELYLSPCAHTLLKTGQSFMKWDAVCVKVGLVERSFHLIFKGPLLNSAMSHLYVKVEQFLWNYYGFTLP